MARKEFDIDVVEYVIMCDNEGALGDPDSAARTKAVENHYKWVTAAKYLGCHSIRVNARSSDNFGAQLDFAVDGLQRLADFGAQHNMNVIVENHGGLSSNGMAVVGDRPSWSA
jgi:L-ribulose-5-phosphate 3-epimerase